MHPLTITGALAEVGAKLDHLNGMQRRLGLPELEHADMTWLERQMELDARVNAVCRSHMANGRPSMEVLDALGAWVVACKIALAEAEEVDVTSGQEAPTA